MKLTSRDPNQTILHEHEEHLNAKRVYVVNDMASSDNKTPIQVHCNIDRIEVPVIVKEYEIKEIEKNLFFPSETKVQIERIEVPVIVKEIEYRDIVREVTLVEKEIERIEVPVIVTEIKIERVEVPVIVKEVQVVETQVVVKETEYKDLPKWIRICLVSQIIISIIMTLKK